LGRRPYFAVPRTCYSLEPTPKKFSLPQIICVVVLATALLSWAPLASLLVRAYRSYRAGIITGILLVWYLLSLFLFAGPYNWTTAVVTGSLATGILAMGVSWAICRGHEITIYGGSIVVPAPTLIPDGFLESEEVRFDLPISVWSQDRTEPGRVHQISRGCRRGASCSSGRNNRTIWRG
jgi:hypothetical protein